MNPADLPERMARRIVESDSDCWEWTGVLSHNGYGLVTVERRMRQVHRFVYELLSGPIPEGLQLDHLCRVRHCCNPEHLEPVTGAENIRRGVEARTHCKQGHLYDEANTYMRNDGARRCRKCHNATALAHYYRNKAAA